MCRLLTGSTRGVEGPLGEFVCVSKQKSRGSRVDVLWDSGEAGALDAPTDRRHPRSLCVTAGSGPAYPSSLLKDVTAPSLCELAWMRAFHILHYSFLSLDKMTVSFCPLPLSLHLIFWVKSSDLVAAYGHKDGGRKKKHRERKSDWVYKEGEQPGTEWLNWWDWKKKRMIV